MVKLYDRIREKTSTPGTGKVFLNGSFSGYDTFSSRYQDGESLFYYMSDNKNYEGGLGIYNSGDNSVKRKEVYQSSNKNEKINWSSTIKEIYVTYPAQKTIYVLDSGNAPELSHWVDNNTTSFTDGISYDGNLNVQNLEGSISGDFLISSGLNFLGFQEQQTQPFLRNEVLDNISGEVFLSGVVNERPGFLEQPSGTVFATSDSGYPYFRLLNSGDVGQIDANKVRYVPFTSSKWTPNTARDAQQGFDSLAFNIQNRLDKFPEYTIASGGNVDTLDDLDSTDFALKDHFHERLTYAKIVDTQQELNEALSQIVTQEEVFDSWYRFSHNASNNFPAIPAETGTWRFDNDENFVASIINSDSYIGFVSDGIFDQYTLEATLRSNAGVVETFPGTTGNTGNFKDNDSIGLVIAFDKDPITGWEYTLSIIVNREPFGATAANKGGFDLIYNLHQSDKQTLLSEPHFDPTEAGVSQVNQVNSAWSQRYPLGIRVKIERIKNIIRLFRSDFDDPDNLRTGIGEFFEFDLNSNPLTQRFLGRKQYGFSALSQYDSQFIDTSFSDFSNVIYNLLDDNVYSYSELESEWQIDSGRSIEELGNDIFVRNEATEKNFYLKNINQIEDISTSFEHIEENQGSFEIANWVYNSGVVSFEDYFYETREGALKINLDDMVGVSFLETGVSPSPSPIIGQSGTPFETDGNEPLNTLPRNMGAIRIDDSGVYYDINSSGLVDTLFLGYLE